ncbi:MAG: sugar ABC transporter permease [Oscillospiraceae bacterium]|nr:sugar ABC transporter permease [Oscillospiraceae bacterium]
MNLLQEAKTLLTKNIREYGMYIALFVIMIFFEITTKGLFMSSRNLSNLIDATGYIAVLAVGMTLIIVIRHIDLSVGYVAGFLGAIAAIFLTQFHIPVVIALILVLIFGAIIGVINGFFVARIGVPAFVISLAGMFIFRGLLLKVTAKTGTIIIPNAFFKALGSGFIPSLTKVNGMHLLTILIGIVVIILYILNEIRTRNNNKKYGFDVLSSSMFIIKLLFISFIVAYFFIILAKYNGLSWTAVIMIIVAVIYQFITTQTPLGRHIYAVGGNPEAAELSGINVSKITLIVFGSMSMLAALAGILYASRLGSAATQAGAGFELDAIAAAYVGGVSAAGGVGKITGSIVGALVMSSLTSGMTLMGTGADSQYIIKGAILVLAVVFDVVTRNKAK